jgi:cell filamentation protein
LRPATKYDAIGPEAEHEPGSRGRVLSNLVGVRSAREMERFESEALVAATSRAVDETSGDQRLVAADICRWHRYWLGGLYPWAGHYRQVNLSKGGFMFASAEQVPRLMNELERGPLREHTPCPPGDAAVIAHRLAEVHSELILIHPFRDGNGRCARLVAIIMALQAKLPGLDFGGIRGRAKGRYFQAIQTAMGRNYEPMATAFLAVIRRTLAAVGAEPR